MKTLRLWGEVGSVGARTATTRSSRLACVVGRQAWQHGGSGGGAAVYNGQRHRGLATCWWRGAALTYHHHHHRLPECSTVLSQPLCGEGKEQRRGLAFRRKRTRQVLVDDAITSDVVQLVSLEGRNMGNVALADAKLLAKQKGLRLACVVPLANPPVCRLQRIPVVADLPDDDADLDDDDVDSDYVSSSSSGKGESNEADAKKRPKGEKELRFSDAIAEHDVQTKVTQLRRFLDKGLRVRLSVHFKSPGDFDPELARALLDNIAARAEDLGRVESDITFASRFGTVLVVPTKTP